VTEIELPLETAIERRSDDAPERLLEVAPVRRSIEAGLELGVKAREVGPELLSETVIKQLSNAGGCCGVQIRLLEAAAALGNRRRAGRLGIGRGDDVA
jgi:hypothetical protein